MNKNNISFKKINNRLILANGLLLIAFFAIQIITTSSVGTKTQEIDYTRNEKALLRQQNSFLEAEIANQKSITQAQGLIEKYGLNQKSATFLQETNLDGIALNY